MEGIADVPYQIADAHLPEAAAVFDAATALDTARDMAAPQPTLVELLGSHMLLPREFLPQSGINSCELPGETIPQIASIENLRQSQFFDLPNPVKVFSLSLTL
jgi:hypothetical protein